MIVHSFLPTTNIVVLRNVHTAALQLAAEYRRHEDAQSAASALFRDPEAVGVIWSQAPGPVLKFVREWRRADIGNLLVVLLHVDAAHHASFSAVLNAGADDVQDDRITAVEITARLDALSRRHRPEIRTISFSGFTLDKGTGLLQMQGRTVGLTRIEADMLELLVDRKSVVTKEMFLDALYGGRDEPELKIIDVFICHLRKKIARLSNAQIIETVWGRGFRYVGQDLIADCAPADPKGDR